MSAPRNAYVVLEPDGGERVIWVAGRPQWALDELLAAGDEGCTPIDHPGPRWSDYIFKLKRRFGLSIETIHEAHHGEFPGHHARYVLRSKVRRLADPAHVQLSATGTPQWEPETVSGEAAP